MKRPFIVLTAVFLVLCAIYLWHRQQPEQKIGRVVDRIIEHVEHQRISLRQPDTVRNVMELSLTEEVDVTAKSHLPTGIISRDDLIKELATIHSVLGRLEVNESARTIEVTGQSAQVTLTLEVKAIVTKTQMITETWDLVLDLVESDHWRVTAAKGQKH